MKLAYKLIAAVTMVVLIVLSAYAWLSVLRESELFRSDMRRDHQAAGRAVASAVSTVADEVGDERAAELVRRASLAELDLRLSLVWLDAPPSSPFAARGAEVIGALSRDEEVLGDVRGAEIVSLVPFSTGSGRRGAIRLTESRAEERRYVRATVVRSTLTALVMTVACAVVVAFLALRLIARPLTRLVTQARRVGAGDFSLRLAFVQKDEMADLALEMDSMCDKLDLAQRRVQTETETRIAALEQLRHADRLNTVGKLASGVAHELGTPLNVVQGRAKLIIDAVHEAGIAESDAGPVVRHAEIIAEQAERMTKIIRQMLDFARRGSPRKDLVDLADIARRALALLEPMARKSGVTLEVEAASDTKTLADPAAVQHVLTNLAVNGIQAMPRGGRLSIRIARERREPPPGAGGEPGDYLCLRVEDEGAGMTSEVLDHAFEPFFTTKDVGEGTGLGLSVSYGIVHDHGGFIAVDSEPGKGSRFDVCLPA